MDARRKRNERKGIQFFNRGIKDSIKPFATFAKAFATLAVKNYNREAQGENARNARKYS